MEDTPVKQRQALKLRASSYNITTLSLLDNNIKSLAGQLRDKITLAPNFFQNAPVVIDLYQLHDTNKFIDFNELKNALNDMGLLLIGVKNANLHHSVHAKNSGLAILAHNQKSTAPLMTDEIKEGQTSKIVTTPVRSGQQVINEHGDLTICSHVGNGAEVVASGNIHIYGPLKGKAIAGMRGDKRSRIFCSSIQAELISIAGIYMPSEEIEKIVWKKPAVIYVQGNHLCIEQI